MSERAILKTLIVYLLIGCFLVSNISCVCASSDISANSYENKTEVSEEKQSLEEVQDSDEQLKSSENADMQSSENNESESEGTQPASSG